MSQPSDTYAFPPLTVFVSSHARTHTHTRAISILAFSVTNGKKLKRKARMRETKKVRKTQRRGQQVKLKCWMDGKLGKVLYVFSSER